MVLPALAKALFQESHLKEAGGGVMGQIEDRVCPSRAGFIVQFSAPARANVSSVTANQILCELRGRSLFFKPLTFKCGVEIQIVFCCNLHRRNISPVHFWGL